MVKLLIFILGSFVFTFGLAPSIINLLYKLRIQEEIRRSGPATHLIKQGTPTMAGLMIVLSVAAISLIFNLSRSETYLPIFALLMAGLLGAAEDIFKIYYRDLIRAGQEGSPAVATPTVLETKTLKIILLPWRFFRSLLGDLSSHDSFGLKSYQKYLLQILIGSFFALWFYLKLDWGSYWFPLLGYVDFGFFYIPVTIFLFTWFVNSVAITDGLDGLAGGLLIELFGVLAIIALWQNQLGLALFCATLVGALTAFLYFNFYPARVFMGNVGSHALGAAAFVVAYMLHKEILLFIIGGVFTVEILSDFIQITSKKWQGKKAFLMAPLHHHFELLGWAETKVTLRFWLAGFVFGLLGLILSLI